jgi:dTMP kinase
VTDALFISFEGPDGSGKSTQAEMLSRALRERGLPVVHTREPGGTPLGELVRHIFLTPGGVPMTPLAMAMLLSAQRTQHVNDVIRPALEAAKIVVTDRFADSTRAYQGYGMGLGLEAIETLTALATDGMNPDITVYIDVEPEVGLARVASRGGANRLDQENLEFHRRARNGYLALMRTQPQRWLYIDGTPSPDEVHAAVLRSIESRIGPKEGTS